MVQHPNSNPFWYKSFYFYLVLFLYKKIKKATTTIYTKHQHRKTSTTHHRVRGTAFSQNKVLFYIWPENRSFLLIFNFIEQILCIWMSIWAWINSLGKMNPTELILFYFKLATKCLWQSLFFFFGRLQWVVLNTVVTFINYLKCRCKHA